MTKTKNKDKTVDVFGWTKSQHRTAVKLIDLAEEQLLGYQEEIRDNGDENHNYDGEDGTLGLCAAFENAVALLFGYGLEDENLRKDSMTLYSIGPFLNGYDEDGLDAAGYDSWGVMGPLRKLADDWQDILATEMHNVAPRHGAGEHVYLWSCDREGDKQRLAVLAEMREFHKMRSR